MITSRTSRPALIVIAIALMATGAALGAATESASPIGNSNVGKTETALGDLTADAARVALGADVALIAASELKATDTPIPAGTVDSNQVAALISYPNDSLALVTMTGATLREALERCVSIYPQPNLGFLQVSGLRMTFNPSKPAGQRIASVIARGLELDSSKSYRVAMTKSMADGALGYWKVWKNSEKTVQQGTTLVTAIEAYFGKNPRIDYSTLNRITPAS